MIASQMPLIGGTSLSLTHEDIQLVRDYVEANKAQLDARLVNSNKVSEFIRHADSKLPFSIEYFKDGTSFMYPKGKRSWGRYKDACYAYSVNSNEWFIRLKFRGEERRYRREIEALSHLGKVDGVVQNLFASSYPRKRWDQEKFHCIRKVYDQFELTWSRKFSEACLRVIALSLLKGLGNIHAMGYVHNDPISCNFLIEIVDGKVVDAVICDFDEAELDSSEAKRQDDLNKVLGEVRVMYSLQGLACPSMLNSSKDTSADKLFHLFQEYCERNELLADKRLYFVRQARDIHDTNFAHGADF
jgi:serine/threonine protein kinase